MPWLWSNPNPQGPTFAQLSGHIEPRMPDLGPLVSALMKYRQQQAKEQQDSLNSLISGIGKAAGGIMGGIGQMNAQGQADDAANAAIYGQQYPQDAMGGFTDPNRVPDYGGVDALRAMKMTGQFNTNGPSSGVWGKDPYGNPVFYGARGGLHYPPSTVMPDTSNDEVLKAAKAIVDNYSKTTGITPDILSSKTAVHSEPDKGYGPFNFGAGNPIKPGQYRVDLPETSKEDAHSIDVDAAEFDRAHKALDQMNQILNSRLSGQVGASTYTPGMGDPRMEGGRLDATGHPAVSYQLSPTGATFAVKPSDPRFGMKITATNPDGRQVTGTATDFGPGVKNVDIASSNPAEAKSSPFDNAVVTPTPQDAGKGLQPGTQRTVLGVTYVWTGDRWNPVK